MSWLERINSEFIIKCGDGREYRPLWMNAVKSYEFNVSEFEFINQRGAKVVREEVKARRFNLTLHFEGENVLDISDNFERSTFDKRPWTITHPMYGQLTVQPLGLNFDNTKFNITTITCTVVETLLDNFPQTNDDFVDIIEQRANVTNEALASALESEELSASDLQEVQQQQRSLYNQGKNIATGLDAETYFNLFNDANNFLFVAQDNTIQSIIATQRFILAPANFILSTRTRQNILTKQFLELLNFLPRALNRPKKMIFQSNGGTLISAKALTLSTPDLNVDFKTGVEVLNYAQSLHTDLNTYLTSIESLQTDNGGELDSYIPNYEPIKELIDLVNYTVVNLINIAVNSKTERSIILNYDTNAIELTHRLYGLDANDNNLNDLINQNDLSFDELLIIPQNKKIVYYV
jgi:predicted oxidoreductase (fatty acid repression mutant protein)